jgi:Cys-tRNA(Pro)/Cys-tRNA(Cys) deacylase
MAAALCYNSARVMIMELKTNVMRLIEQKKLSYTPHSYAGTEAISGVEVASALGRTKTLFKTLVNGEKAADTMSFVIPEAEGLTQKGEQSSGRKKLRMVQIQSAAAADGLYPRRCSPIGLKNSFTTRLTRRPETAPPSFQRRQDRLEGGDVAGIWRR